MRKPTKLNILCLLMLCSLTIAKTQPVLLPDPQMRGLSFMEFKQSAHARNFIDRNDYLGDVQVNYTLRDQMYSFSTLSSKAQVLSNNSTRLSLYWLLPEGVRLYQNFYIREGGVHWDIDLFNRTDTPLSITELFVRIPIGRMDESIDAPRNMCRHNSINGHSSYIYWTAFSGQDSVLVMTLKEGTSLEYETSNGHYYIHSTNSSIQTDKTMRLPSTTRTIGAHQRFVYGFVFTLARDNDSAKEVMITSGNLLARVMPGMVAPVNTKVKCALECNEIISKVSAEYPSDTKIELLQTLPNGKSVYAFTFCRLGENMITVDYGNNKHSFLDFFITEPIETVIKKRAKFITEKQQHTDPSKWYNGLYSVWDMEKTLLLSPDEHQLLPEFVVGGSDDPSNCKPLLISEKNVFFPNRDEIAALEYYQDHFVWGKLQRAEDEFPYPYGIYGSENWFQNRSGTYGGWDSGGWGLERLWRTFDYTTHLAIYYNMYLIGSADPTLLKKDAWVYLNRAYLTAMAYFNVPYTILMGDKWAFHGWCDWAYKQGNFHERYITDIIKVLDECGEKEKATSLRTEWEKKVLYFLYEDSWPFGSEMFVDRTAFESSYYIAAYGMQNHIEPRKLLWYDKNLCKWYSYDAYEPSRAEILMRNQLDANLALRGIFGQSYHSLGTSWTGMNTELDYMSQMGGVALLDYAMHYSNDPSKFINYGFNSLYASWALVNSGTPESGYGYWFPGEKSDGAAGWVFSPYSNNRTYFSGITTGRGPWRYCGEIDHGFTGAIHGSGTYVVDDPDFGIVAYGGLLTEHQDVIIVIPNDGTQRRVFFAFDNRLGVELRQDGFRKDAPILCHRNMSRLEFEIENRFGTSHLCTLEFSGLMTGNYSLAVDGKPVEMFHTTSSQMRWIVHIPLNGPHHKITLIKQ